MNIAAPNFMTEAVENISTETLNDVIEKYPYFTVAQFFLSKKLKQENAPEFLPQLQKTALYFSNPYWLHYQLLHEDVFNKKAVLPETQPQHAFEAGDTKEIVTENIPSTSIDEEETLKKDISKLLEENFDVEAIIADEPIKINVSKSTDDSFWDGDDDYDETLINDDKTEGESLIFDNHIFAEKIIEPETNFIQPAKDENLIQHDIFFS